MTDHALSEANFSRIMQRAIDLVGQKVPQERLREVAKTVDALCWHFRDLEQKVYFVISEAGVVSSPSAPDADVATIISIDARVFHDAAFGKTSLTAAFMLGRMKIKGISVLKLGKFAPLMKPFLESYCEAFTSYHE